MEDLPDDVLVHLFSFLDTEMLVRELRAVCTRWRSLALDPDAWRHRSVSCRVIFANYVLLKRVLALAPCLYELEVRLLVSDGPRYVEQEQELMKLAAATSCAVRCLRVDGRCSPRLDLVSCLLRRQGALGRLRRLSLLLRSGVGQLFGMLEAVADLDLDLLDLKNKRWEPAYQETFPATTAGRWGKGSLKELRLSSHVNLDPLLEFVVRHRSASLQSVHVDDVRDPDVSSTPWVAALGGCSKLEFATVPAVMEVASLAACPSLTHLVITARIAMNAVTSYYMDQYSTNLPLSLPGLTQLRVLEILPECNVAPLSAEQVLSALALSGASQVEDLKLSIFPIHEALSLQELGNGLPRNALPRLHTLRLYNFPSADYLIDLIHSLSGGAPRLILLELTERSDRVHLSLTKDACKVLQVHPQLHVVPKYLKRSKLNGPPQAQGWYGHHPEVDCGFLHDSAVQWQWLTEAPE